MNYQSPPRVARQIPSNGTQQLGVPPLLGFVDLYLLPHPLVLQLELFFQLLQFVDLPAGLGTTPSMVELGVIGLVVRIAGTACADIEQVPEPGFELDLLDFPLELLLRVDRGSPQQGFQMGYFGCLPGHGLLVQFLLREVLGQSTAYVVPQLRN